MTKADKTQAAISEAVALVEEEIKEFLVAHAGHARDGEVTIVTWSEGFWGLRVAEVSWWQQMDIGGGGWSYMQTSLPEGLAVCAQVERLIIAIVALVVQAGEQEEVERERESLFDLLRIGDDPS